MNEKQLRYGLLGEFLGTCLLVILGDGVVASVVLLYKQADWIVITTGWALAVTVSVYVSGGLSGGHLNPAVTLALASRGDFPKRCVVPYWIAQFLGAFVGALILYLDYYSAFADFETAQGITRGALEQGSLVGKAAGGAGVFATYPAYPNLFGNLLSEFLGTAILLIGARAVSDPRNAKVPPALQPALIGAIVFAIGISLGGLTGYAINPARDLGPRVASSILGWGTSVFISNDYYFWIPIVGPLLGGLAGIAFYDNLIGKGLEAVARDQAA